MIKLSGTLAVFYGWDRALLQALVVLAISLCWSMQCLAEWRAKRQASILAIAAASLTVIFICASGLADVAVGGGTLNGGTPLNLANSGEDFNRYYVTASELASARWLGEAAQPGQFVYADRYAQLRLFAMNRDESQPDRRRDPADTQSARMGVREPYQCHRPHCRSGIQ